MDLGLAGRVALVTAASRGLGFASAAALAAEGASVLICARGADQIQAAVEQLQRQATGGAQVAGMVCDVAAPGAAAQLIGRARERFGRLDVLVNNAGGPPPGKFEQLTDVDWEQAFNLTLMSVVHLVREALPLLKASGQGRIINIVSTSVKQPIDNLMLSNAIRAAVVGLAKTLSREVARAGITVNNVLPGTILTGRLQELRGVEATRRGMSLEQVISEAGAQVPAGRIGQPEDIGALVAFLASARAGYIVGDSIAVDGGVILAAL
ncbi:MAG: SDR family oxidoreductase [Ktedonobacterales bacterium]